jgi:hypothetical protein
MKKYSMIIALGMLSLLFFGATKLPYISAGTYLVKMVNIGRDEFFGNDFTDVFQTANEANLIDSKPNELMVTPELEKLTDIRYGSFKLGNNEKDVWFVMGKDPAGYYSKIYIDQNLDYNISDEEKVQDIQTFDRRLKGIMVHFASAQTTPVPLTVSYKGMTGEIKKKVYFYLWARIFEKNDTDTSTVTIATISALQGLIRVMVGRNEKLVKFRLLDTNSNGCFNDYGKDVICMDLNYDGLYQENQTLSEYFDIKTDTGKKQIHFIVLPFPGKVQVTEAIQEFDASKLEPEPDMI